MLILVVCGLILYFAPWMVAKHRQHNDITAIAVVNVALGWTVLGWFAALVWACTGNVRKASEVG